MKARVAMWILVIGLAVGLGLVAHASTESLVSPAEAEVQVQVFTAEPECTPPPNGLVSWWRGEGDSQDAIGTNPGTQRNGAGFAPASSGKGSCSTGTTTSASRIPRRLKEQALSRTTPHQVTPSRYKPSDQLLAFLEGL